MPTRNPTMMKVNDWSTTRSGATMTVTGKAEGADVRLTGVDSVEGKRGKVIARRAGREIAELVA